MASNERFLEGRALVVTGGASGLGAAVAEGIEKAGGRAFVLDRCEPQVGSGWERVDLADGRTAEAAVERVARQAGGLHGVVTAAGIDACGDLADVAADDWERVVAVNLLGTVAVVRAALPHLRRTGGRVVTVASTLGLRALPAATAYCASKFGVVGFSRAFAAETAGQIGVTTLIPGGMDTAFFDDRPAQFKPPPDLRMNRPEDVAAAVLFALAQPAGCEVRELVVTPSGETSWP